MTLLEIVLIAVGLAMDCFAVAIASSVSYGHYNWPKMLRMGLFFGLFQGVMPLFGWLAGVSFAAQITAIDHWLAFVILGYLGVKMGVEGFKKNDNDTCCHKNTPFGSFKMLITLSFATSIDALATGLIFVPMGHLIYTASGIIALVSLVFTILGCIIGITFGKRFKINVELIGGLILFAIGTKILIEHLWVGC